MEQKEWSINGTTYRVRRMNAIEFMALRSLVDFKDYESTIKMYSTILENMEVEFNGKWYPVKSDSTYYPAGIEDDFETIDILINKFVKEFMLPLFQKSNGLKA